MNYSRASGSPSLAMAGAHLQLPSSLESSCFISIFPAKCQWIRIRSLSPQHSCPGGGPSVAWSLPHGPGPPRPLLAHRPPDRRPPPPPPRCVMLRSCTAPEIWILSPGATWSEGTTRSPRSWRVWASSCCTSSRCWPSPASGTGSPARPPSWSGPKTTVRRRLAFARLPGLLSPSKPFGWLSFLTYFSKHSFFFVSAQENKTKLFSGH